MKKITLISLSFVLLLSSIVLNAQETLLPKWRVGDAFQVQQTGSVSMDIYGLEMKMDVKESYKLEVLSKEPESYLILISDIESVGIDGSGPFVKMILDSIFTPEVRDALDMVKNMQCRVRIDKRGNIIDLENWKDIRGKLIDLTRVLIDVTMDKYGLENSQKDSLVTVAIRTIDTKEKVMQSTLQFLEYMFSAYNIEFPAKGVLDVPVEMYSRMPYFELNNSNIPAILKTSTVFSGVKRSKYKYDVIYDRDELIDEVLKSKEGSDLDMSMLESMKFTEQREFDIDLSTSWPKNIVITSTIETADVFRVDLDVTYSFVKL